MNWELYVSRRKINIPSWMESKGVKTQEDFLRALESLGLEPSGDEVISSLFPQKTQEINNESVDVAAEGSDQVATRGVAPEGDGSDLRSDGKRSSKVRS